MVLKLEIISIKVYYNSEIVKWVWSYEHLCSHLTSTKAVAVIIVAIKDSIKYSKVETDSLVSYLQIERFSMRISNHPFLNVCNSLKQSDLTFKSPKSVFEIFASKTNLSMPWIWIRFFGSALQGRFYWYGLFNSIFIIIIIIIKYDSSLCYSDIYPSNYIANTEFNKSSKIGLIKNPLLTIFLWIRQIMSRRKALSPHFVTSISSFVSFSYFEEISCHDFDLGN